MGPAQPETIGEVSNRTCSTFSSNQPSRSFELSRTVFLLQQYSALQPYE